MVPRLVTLTDF